MRRRHEYSDTGICAVCGARTPTQELLARDGYSCLTCWQKTHQRPDKGATKWQLLDRARERRRKNRERLRQWRKAHPEQARAQCRASYYRNWERYRERQNARARAAYQRPEERERQATYRRAYIQANRQKFAARQAAYYQEHREAIRAQRRAYLAANREAINAKARARRAAKRAKSDENPTVSPEGGDT